MNRVGSPALLIAGSTAMETLPRSGKLPLLLTATAVPLVMSGKFSIPCGSPVSAEPSKTRDCERAICF